MRRSIEAGGMGNIVGLQMYESPQDTSGISKEDGENQPQVLTKEQLRNLCPPTAFQVSSIDQTDKNQNYTYRRLPIEEIWQQRADIEKKGYVKLQSNGQEVLARFVDIVDLSVEEMSRVAREFVGYSSMTLSYLESVDPQTLPKDDPKATETYVNHRRMYDRLHHKQVVDGLTIGGALGLYATNKESNMVGLTKFGFGATAGENINLTRKFWEEKSSDPQVLSAMYHRLNAVICVPSIPGYIEMLTKLLSNIMGNVKLDSYYGVVVTANDMDEKVIAKMTKSLARFQYDLVSSDQFAEHAETYVVKMMSPWVVRMYEKFSAQSAE
jgi:hypothetical protein